ncbi:MULTISPECIES: MBL fold metallo-hydrolase [Pseudonocardia]|uniref:Glyoxylase-like metal-dependent hydrolase (Beta-lactamase superfamily II) n=1 Tax=Pseudonocardia alni TaxID=33907 RepID=A0AA44UNF8_PSEA5|nr:MULTISPECIES: MBL fold metallo-hydrolase [Pseudonocardia]MYW71665.1 MBL fold metallo-hydrolase [Pseudonocardia sp. SID8383]OJG06733.1 Metallo-beta-lactamase superfamily protein [Pseudonocardia autotrophica]PKB30431.1 glyoxylase-like metal-dependent hydrolase (beta-lactamase superfamily II) [Pseudonocardia alni]
MDGQRSGGQRSDGRWLELADGVLARRHHELDLTTGLVLGTSAALVIDTRGDTAQGAELATAVRAVTALPAVVALTHAHFDHCFGTAAFPGAPVYAQAGCAGALLATAAAQRAHWSRHYRDAGSAGSSGGSGSSAAATADALAATVPVLPDRPVCPRPASVHTLDLGGRVVQLVHPGPAHTGHDLAVHVPDAGVLFAGDLLENGAPPSFGPDSYRRDWAAAVGLLLDVAAAPAATGTRVFVPGHGDPLSPDEAAAQHADLLRIARAAEASAAVVPGALPENSLDR